MSEIDLLPADEIGEQPAFIRTLRSFVSDDRATGLRLNGMKGLNAKMRQELIERGAVYQPSLGEKLKGWIGRAGS